MHAGWFCRDSSTRAYRNTYCEVTTYSPCTNGMCCSNGNCYIDRIKICGKTTVYSGIPEAKIAQTMGPLLQGQYLFIFCMAFLMGLVVYAFLKTETKI